MCIRDRAVGGQVGDLLLGLQNLYPFGECRTDVYKRQLLPFAACVRCLIRIGRRIDLIVPARDNRGRHTGVILGHLRFCLLYTSACRMDLGQSIRLDFRHLGRDLQLLWHQFALEGNGLGLSLIHI